MWFILPPVYPPRNSMASGSEVGITGSVGLNHEQLTTNKHLLTVTASPGIGETEGLIFQRQLVLASKFAAKACPSRYDFIHDPNFVQPVAAGFMKRTKTYVFQCS